MRERLTRENAVWSIVILMLVLVSAAVGFVITGFLTPVVGVLALAVGVLGTIGTFILGAVSIANQIFDFIDNVESRILGHNSEDRESSRIGGQNVTKREEVINEQLDRLKGWYTVYEDESWEIHPEETIADDPKYLLYLLTAKVASENGAREDSEVSVAELEQNVDTKFPTGPFINKSQHFLTLHYDHDEEWVGHTIEENEAMIEFDFDAIEEGVDWILSGSRNPPREYDSG